MKPAVAPPMLSLLCSGGCAEQPPRVAQSPSLVAPSNQAAKSSALSDKEIANGHRDAASEEIFASFDSSPAHHSHITIRTLADFAEHLGLEPRAEAVLSAAAQQSRLAYEPKLSAAAINDYIRAGFVGAP